MRRGLAAAGGVPKLNRTGVGYVSTMDPLRDEGGSTSAQTNVMTAAQAASVSAAGAAGGSA